VAHKDVRASIILTALVGASVLPDHEVKLSAQSSRLRRLTTRAETHLSDALKSRALELLYMNTSDSPTMEGADWFDTKAPTCFMSHDSVDKPQARAIAFFLKSSGIRPWIDQYSLLSDRVGWRDRILEGLDNATAVAICLSPAALDRMERESEPTFFEREMREAHGRGSLLIPVALHNSVDSMFERVRKRTSIDLSVFHAVKLFGSESSGIANRTAASQRGQYASQLNLMVESIWNAAGHRPRRNGLAGSRDGLQSERLADDVSSLLHDIAFLQYGLEFADRFRTTTVHRLEFLATMRSAYAVWVSEVAAESEWRDLDSLLASVEVPESLHLKGVTPLRHWAGAKERSSDIVGATALLWRFCFWFYASPDPQFRSGPCEISNTYDLNDFDLRLRLDQAKLFNEIGLALERGDLVPSSIGFLENNLPLIKLLTFIEIARVFLNVDVGQGKSGLWGLAQTWSARGVRAR
jgi:hypothetical protein